jgi:vacuolar-type H+-ATPase subunit F/Vma7
MTSNPFIARLNNFGGLLSDIKASDVFDQSWYRRQCIGARLSPSPLLHYMLVGWKRGLNPSPRFDTKFYIERYRDVRESRSNPLTHYMIHGRHEGRLATRSGRIFRESLLPEYAPLPVFGSPADSHPRLTVVIDDHTPKLLGVGYLPLLGLALHTAGAAGFSLRVLIRSTSITTAEVSSALNAVSGDSRPTIDISRRTPGPTDDVDTTETEVWWASSASSMESLRHLIPSSKLWWVMTADEASRHPAGEHQEAVNHLLGHKDVQVIAVGEDLAKALPTARVAHVVKALPSLIGIKKTAHPGKALGVVVVPELSESLSSTSTAVLEHALTHEVLDPSTWSITLIGLDWEPLTLSGSVVVNQAHPNNPEEWSAVLSGQDAALVVQAGSEPRWLASEMMASGIPVASGKGSVSELSGALKKALSAKTTPSKAVTWSDIVTPLSHLVASSNG